MPDYPMVPPPPEGLMEKRAQHEFYNWEAWPYTQREYEMSQANHNVGAALREIHHTLSGIGFGLNVFVYPEMDEQEDMVHVRTSPVIDSHPRNQVSAKAANVTEALFQLRQKMSLMEWCAEHHAWHTYFDAPGAEAMADHKSMWSEVE